VTIGEMISPRRWADMIFPRTPARKLYAIWARRHPVPAPDPDQPRQSTETAADGPDVGHT